MYIIPAQSSFRKSGKNFIRRMLILAAGILAVRNSNNNLFSIPANIIAAMLNKNIENGPLIPTMQPTFEIDKVSLETNSELMNANLRKRVQTNEINNAAVTKKPTAKPSSAKLTSAKPTAKPRIKIITAKPTEIPTKNPTPKPTPNPIANPTQTPIANPTPNPIANPTYSQVKGCFKGDTIILINDNEYKKISEIKKDEKILLSDGNIGIVKILVKYGSLNNLANLSNVDGFYVTDKHPIYKISNEYKYNTSMDWIYPKDIVKENMMQCDYVYSIYILMEDGSLPKAGFIVKGIKNNWGAVPVGREINHKLLKTPFWNKGIATIINTNEFKPDNNGVLELESNLHRIVKISEPNNYGLWYKNKLYTYENNIVIISEN